MSAGGPSLANPRRRMSLRRQLLLFFLVPAFTLFLLSEVALYARARRVLEDQLGRSLSLQAAAAASQLSPERLLLLQPGDESTRTYRNLLHTLEQVRAATGARRVFAFDRQGRMRVDTAALPVGTEVPELARDTLELQEVWAGRDSYSSVLFEAEGQLFKTGYAPLRQDQDIVGAVAVEGSAAFFTPLRSLARSFLLLDLAALVVLALFTLLAAGRITRPLRRLMRSASGIASGDLATPVAVQGTREIATLAGELEAMRHQLEARETQLKMMLAGVAHEVRNPLGGMELFLGLLKEELGSNPATLPQARAHLDHLVADLDYLKRIVEDFLLFAREQKLNPKPVRARELARAAVERLTPEAQARSVQLAVEAHDAPLMADPDLLTAALVNLVKNAVQASPPGGTVRLRGNDRDGRYTLEVEDQGPGVPPEDQHRIFEPFFTTRQQGTGLGLPLARKIVQAHQGSLELAPSEQGARFRLTLPCAPPA